MMKRVHKFIIYSIYQTRCSTTLFTINEESAVIGSILIVDCKGTIVGSWAFVGDIMWWQDRYDDQ